MKSTFTNSHTLWATTKTWLATAASATCFTTQEKARMTKIYQGVNTGTICGIAGFSTGVFISSEDRNYLIKIWVRMLTAYSG
jgi:predicted CDP-diglyceride synthetase/phosphatidate cytidylyltransferase